MTCADVRLWNQSLPHFLLTTAGERSAIVRHALGCEGCRRYLLMQERLWEGVVGAAGLDRLLKNMVDADLADPEFH